MNTLFSTKLLKAGLIVGTLDILAAFINFFVKTHKGPAPVLKFIAAGVFGKDALTGGSRMVVLGLLFHYLIAFTFTLFFFWIAEKVPAVLKFRILTGVMYGIFIWTVMQFLVLPLSRVPRLPFNPVNAFVAVIILIICIGIPLSFMASRHTSPDK